MAKKNRSKKLANAIREIKAKNNSNKSVERALATSAPTRKKKKRSFWGNVMDFASSALPAVLPIASALLAGPRGRARLGAMPAGTYASAAAVANPAPIASNVGIQDMVAVKDDRGHVIGMRLTGLDYLGDIEVGVDGIPMGTVLFETDLNPRSTKWAGTRLQHFATLWTRFRVHRMCGCYASACSALSVGQLCMFINTDPAEKFTPTGATAVQFATTYAGAGIGQVWQDVHADYVTDTKTQDQYLDANGSDIRLTSPGTLRAIATTDISIEATGSVPAGSIFVAYDIELSIAQLEGAQSPGSYFVSGIESTTYTVNPNQPMFNTEPVHSAGALRVTTVGTPGSGYSFIVPPGLYHVVIVVTGSASLDATPDWYFSGDSATLYAVNNETEEVSVRAMSFTQDEGASAAFTWLWSAGGSNLGTGLTVYQYIYSVPNSAPSPTLQSFEDLVRTLTRRIDVLENGRAAGGGSVTAVALPSAHKVVPKVSRPRPRAISSAALAVKPNI